MVGSRMEPFIQVEYVFQELDKLPEGYTVPEGRVKPFGTGHALLCCKDVVKSHLWSSMPMTIMDRRLFR